MGQPPSKTLNSSEVASRLASNRLTFEAMVARAELSLKQGSLDAAAVRLQSAARFAWFSHGGSFCSQGWTSVAERVASAIDIGDSAEGVARFDGHVIHVLTQAYGVGGHTRLVSRWIESNSNNTHSVILTGQQGAPVPTELRDAVAAAGGELVDLGVSKSTLVKRAQELRAIALAGPKYLVLHIHPYDVVPSIALRNVGTGKVFLNHADHVFSVGMEVADIVADIRPAGRRLSQAARCISAERSFLLPLPLAEAAEVDRDASRRNLGLGENDVVLVTMASSYKYSAGSPDHFVDVHRQILEDNPAVRLLVAGPSPEGRWKELSLATAGRSRALGRVENVDELYAAADVYLDSFPFASLTSLLDASLRGVPAVAFSGLRTDSVLSADDVALAVDETHFAEKSRYLDHLRLLIGDRGVRERTGLLQQQAINAAHCPPEWTSTLASLEQFLHTAVSLRGAGFLDDREIAVSETSNGELQWLHEELIRFQISAQLSEPAWLVELRDAPFASFKMRFALWWNVPIPRKVWALRFMIPDAFRSRMKALFMQRR